MHFGHHIQFTGSMPLRTGVESPRRLDTRNPDRWIFKRRFTWYIPFIIFLLTPFFLAVASAARTVWMFWLLLLFPLVAVLLSMTCFLGKCAVFDFENKCFYRDRRKPRYGDPSTLKEYLPFSQISGIQFLYKEIRGSKGNAYQAYEINLLTHELTRVFVADGTNKKQLFEEAQLLAGKLNIPLKENDDNKIKVTKTPLWVILLFAVFFTAGGMGVFSSTVLFPLIKHQKSAHWSETPAMVQQGHLASFKRSRSKGGSYTVYKAVITYQYLYKGKAYTSERYNFFNWEHRNPTTAGNLLKQYPAGKKIICFVNPEKPSESVLSRDIDYWDLLPKIGFSAFILIFGVTFVFIFRKR